MYQVFVLFLFPHISFITAEVVLEDFFPFGISAGDTQLTTDDDASSPEINLGISFPFVGNQETRLWVNTNGDITFAGSYVSFAPECIALGIDSRMIIPFWTDIDMGNGGNVGPIPSLLTQFIV